MVGCCLRCLICFFACSSVLLVVASLNDVEASSCQTVIHRKVGDSVELSSCLPPDGLPADEVTYAQWNYGNLIIADKDGTSNPNHQFKDRFYLNPTNFSLTLQKLTLQDSGNFSFVSEDTDGNQRETVTITLQVHEAITQKPSLTFNSTWYNLNESCVVLLECSAANPSISYNWTVGNQTRSGSRLQYPIRPQDGKTEFTCTIYNFVNKISASVLVECSNETETIKPGGPDEYVTLLAAAGGGCLLIIIILAIAVGVCYCRRTQTGGDLNDHTVYADITEVAHESQTSFPVKPSSVYETVEETVQRVTPGPQTVYDQIQLSRVRKQSVSPYQDVS